MKLDQDSWKFSGKQALRRSVNMHARGSPTISIQHISNQNVKFCFAGTILRYKWYFKGTAQRKRSRE